jgi:hypothetical protein
VTHKDDNQKLLHRYLEQHMAGSVAGIEHAKRMAHLEAGSELGQTLQSLIGELEQESQRLRELARHVGADTKAPVKEGLAWLAEKVARVMVDARVASRSPIARVLDLELMVSAVAGKRALWEALSILGEIDPRLPKPELDQLIAAASAQQETLLRLHRSAVRVAFADLRAEARQRATG